MAILELPELMYGQVHSAPGLKVTTFSRAP